MIVSVLLGSLSVVMAPPTASALLGDGDDYWCAPEFEYCPTSSWCTWYGTCPGGGGGGGGGWGGGGGGGSSPEETAAANSNCGLNKAGVLVDGWIVKDLGTCGTQAICRRTRDAINRVAAGIGRAYCWANWNIPNSNGRHLVYATPANG